jgi:hypothetical protein
LCVYFVYACAMINRTLGKASHSLYEASVRGPRKICREKLFHSDWRSTTEQRRGINGNGLIYPTAGIMDLMSSNPREGTRSCYGCSWC